MSSWTSSHSSVGGSASFPLSKFSFATVSGESVKPIPWSHISDRGHLFATFEKAAAAKYHGEVQEKMQFKVLAENEVLEDFDLIALGREAMNAAHETKTLPSPPKLPAVTVIIQEPCIAVRFPLQYGQIRRFQMKFRLGSDFYKALALFSEAGCPFTQAGSLGPQTQMSRPLTTSSTATLTGDGGQYKESIRSAPSTADSDQRTLVPSLGLSMHSSSRPSTSSSSTWKSEAGTSSYSTTAHDTSLGPARCVKPFISPFFSKTNLTPTSSKAPFNQHENNICAQQEAPSTPPFPSSDPVAASGGIPPSSADETSRPSFVQLAPRPSTAPSFDIQRLTQMLPPKRELPFKVPRAGSENNIRATKNGQADSRVKVSILENSTADYAGAESQTEQRALSVASGPAKKLPAKRTTRAIRPTPTTTSRSRKKPSVLKEDSPVPTVEELLGTSKGLSEKQDYICPRREDSNKALLTSNFPEANTSRDNLESKAIFEVPVVNAGQVGQPADSRIPYQHSNIDTQALLARVDKHQLRQTRKREGLAGIHENETALPPSKRATIDNSLNLAAVPPRNAGHQIPKDGLPEPAAGSAIVRDSNLCDIFSMPMTTNVNTSQAQNSQENDGLPPSAQKPIDGIPARSTSRGDPGASERHPWTEISSTAQPEQPLTLGSRSMMALMNDPDFAKSPELVQWADLPREEREAALETWMCQQLESESFAKLLKGLEGMWQRVFFGT